MTASKSFINSGAYDVFVAKFDGDDAIHFWSHRFEGQNPLRDTAYGRAITVDANGDFYITGYFSGSLDVGGETLLATGNSSIFIAKFKGEDGSHIWSKSLSNKDQNSVYAYSIAADDYDDLIITGYFSGTLNFGGNPLYSTGRRDLFIGKFKCTDGSHKWSHRFGGQNTKRDSIKGYSVAIDKKGDLVVTGYFSGSVNIGEEKFTSVGGSDLFVAKFKGTDGRNVWASSFEGTWEDMGKCLTIDPHDNVLITGYFTGTLDFGDNQLSCTGRRDIFLVKFNGANGHHIWSRSFGGCGPNWDSARAYSIAASKSGNLVITGYFNGTLDFGGGPLISKNNNDVFVAKFKGEDGSHIWSHNYGGKKTSFAHSYAVSFDSNEDVIVTGDFSGTLDLGGGILTSTAKRNLFIAKYNGADGSQVWSHISRGTWETLSRDVTIDKKGNVFITGFSSGIVRKFNMEANCPVLLFPVRLETRFMEDNDELWVRIFPDEASIETHDIELNYHEKVVYRCYCEAESDEERKSVWRELVRRFGPKRAAWIIREGDCSELINAGKNPESSQSIWRKPPRVRNLPDRFVICLYKKDKCVYRAVGNPIPGELPMMGDLEKGLEDDLFNGQSKWVADWMADFGEAEKIGMALKIPLDRDDDKHFTRVIAVGLKFSSSSQGQEMLEDLIDNHHYTSGFSFLPYGTPTNNTMNTKSGYSESSEDPEKSYDIECCERSEEDKVDGNNSQVVARAFGLDPALFCNIENADVNNSLHERELKEVLWPVFGENFLKFALSNPPSDNTCSVLQDHFTEFVTARGPLPAVGIGDQPYGILPVTHINGWKASGLDTHSKVVFYTKLHAILFELYKKWLDMAMDPELVPRVTDGSDDADDELLRILAMEPVSTSYGIRPVVKEPFFYDFRSGRVITPTNRIIIIRPTDQGPVKYKVKTGDEVIKGDLLCSVNGKDYYAPSDGKVNKILHPNKVNKGNTLLQFSGFIKSNRSGSVGFSKFDGDGFKKGDKLVTSSFSLHNGIHDDSYKARYDGKVEKIYGSTNNWSTVDIDGKLIDIIYNIKSSHEGYVEYYIIPGASVKEDDLLCSVDGKDYYAPSDGKVNKIFHPNKVNKGDTLFQFSGFLKSNHSGSVRFQKKEGDQVKEGDSLCNVYYVSNNPYQVPIIYYKAPIDGIVEQIFTLGGWVNSGDKILEFIYNIIKSSDEGIVEYSDKIKKSALIKEGDLLCSVDGKDYYAPSDGKVKDICYPNIVNKYDNLIHIWQYDDYEYNLPPWIFPTAHANEFIASIDKNTTLQEYTSWSKGLNFPTTIKSNHTGSVSFTKEVGVAVNKGELLCSIGSLHKYRAPFSGKVLKVFKFQNEEVKKGDSLIIFGDNFSAEERIRSLIKFSDVVDEKIFKCGGIFMGILDLHTHRLDAWFTSIATKRLHSMRERKSEGIYLGAYGWLEDLQPEEKSKAIEEEYIHAPSADQAAAAAVLRNAFLTQKQSDTGEPFRINLTSDRVRRALRLLDGVWEGQELGALLGYLFERGLHDNGMDRYIDEFRSAFPLVGNKLTEPKAGETAETVAARNVVDGFALAEKWEESEEAVFKLISEKLSDDGKVLDNKEKLGLKNLINNTVMDSQDSMADILLTESMYQLVKINFERAGAALDAIPGKHAPQEIESVQTPLSGTALGHRVCVIFNGMMNSQQGPRSKAEPRLDAWFGDILGDMSRIGCIANIQFDINQATFQELEILHGIGPDKAGLIIADRQEKGDYTRLEDLKRVEGIEDSTINELKNLLDPYPVSLKDLDISPLDFLYMSSFPLSYRGKDDSGIPVSEETELEQRMAYFIRKLRNLPACAVVRFDFERATDNFTRSTAEAVELGRTVLDLLGKSSFLSPDSLWLQEDEDTPALYDIDELLNRVTDAHKGVSGLLERFDVIEKRDETVVDFFNGVINSSEIVERIKDDPNFLRAASRDYGISSSLASKILEVRDSLPKGMFSSIEEIDNIPGICPDTMHDILYSLQVPTDNYEEEISEILIEASRFGIEGTISPSPFADPELVSRKNNAIDEIIARIKKCNKLMGLISWDKISGEGSVKFIDFLERNYKINWAKTDDIKIIDNEIRINSEDHSLSLRLIEGKTKARLTINDVKTDEFIVREKNNTRNIYLAISLRDSGDHSKAINVLVEAMEAVFGDGFKVLPTFTAPNPQDLQTIYQDTSRIHQWLHQAAQVSPALSYLEDTIMACDAWRTRAIDSDSDYSGTLNEIVPETFTLRVAQLPGNGERGWLALSDDELKKGRTEEEIKKMEDNIKQNGRPKGYVSIVSLAPETIDFSNKLAGLLVYEWEEKIPDKQVDTGLSFYYNQPNSQPPQSLLLAVPGELEERESGWTVDELIDIVRDTMDLARVRTVDPEALQYGGPFPPALFLKTESEKLESKLGFYRWVWKNFLEELFCLDFNTFEDGKTLRNSIEKGFRIYNEYGGEFSDEYFPVISSNDNFNYLECPDCSFVLPAPATKVSITVLDRAGTKIATYDDKNQELQIKPTIESTLELMEETFTYTFYSPSGVIHSVLIKGGDGFAAVLKICMKPKEIQNGHY
jgi:competence ComEA-like helix-hairpin-helix protein